MIQELRFTLRSIRRRKFFAMLALIAFTFGIASTSTVFSVIDAILLRPATFPDPLSVVMLQAAQRNRDWNQVSPSVYGSLRTRGDLFSEVAAARESLFTVTRVPAPDQVFGSSVSGNFFEMLHARPWRGRLISPEDDKPGAPPVVLISYKAWQQLFHEDVNVIGKTAQIDGDVCSLIGVMPPDFILPDLNRSGLLWTPLRMTAAELTSPDALWLEVFARLRPGVAPSAVEQNLDRLARTYHDPLRLRATKLVSKTDPNQKLTLWLAMGMVCGLLLIGCANLSSILLARAIARKRDYAIRLATGASRSQLIRQALMEVFVLAIAAFGLACAVTYGALNLIREHLTTTGAGMPNLAHVRLNGYSLFFSFGIALLCALLCGLFPAISTTNIDLASGLRESGSFNDGRRSAHRFLHSLLAIEASISLLLLLTSGLLMRSFSRMLSEDHGLQPDHVLTMRLPTGAWQALSKRRTPEDEQRLISKYLDLLGQAQETSNVQAAALASSLPLSHVAVSTLFISPAREQVDAITQAVTPDYFRVMGIPILSGHTFDLADSHSKRKVVMVNQAFARKYFNGQDPVGRLVLSEDPNDTSQVIGLVKDSPHVDLTEAIEPELYIDFQQVSLMPFLTGLVVRTQGNPAALSQALRNNLSLRNSDQAIVQVKTLQRLIDENVWQPRFSAWLSTAFAGIALAMCGIGIYGVVAYVTAARRRDFGIRVALGAGRSNLLRLAATQSLLPVMIGSLFGLLAFYWTSKWIASLLYKTSPLDPGNALAAALILFGISVAAVARPALRAARVDPAITLRHE